MNLNTSRRLANRQCNVIIAKKMPTERHRETHFAEYVNKRFNSNLEKVKKSPQNNCDLGLTQTSINVL